MNDEIKKEKNRKTERKKFTLLRNFPNSKAKVKGIKKMKKREKIINQKIQKGLVNDRRQSKCIY